MGGEATLGTLSDGIAEAAFLELQCVHVRHGDPGCGHVPVSDTGAAQRVTF